MSYENHVYVETAPGFIDATTIRQGIERSELDDDWKRSALADLHDSDVGFTVGDDGGDVTVYGSKDKVLAWFEAGVRELQGRK